MPVAGELVTLVSIGAVALYTLVTAASRAIDRLLALAEYYDVDELIVGMTILAVGTSLPEISASSWASSSSGTARSLPPGRSSGKATCRCWECSS